MSIENVLNLTTTRRRRRRRTTTTGRRRRTTTTRRTTTLRRRRRPKGPKGGPKGPKEARRAKGGPKGLILEVGARRAHELLVEGYLAVSASTPTSATLHFAVVLCASHSIRNSSWV